jgi:hypothetical protein
MQRVRWIHASRPARRYPDGKEPERCQNGTSQTMTDSDQSAQHLFSADRPITSRDQDQLYRRTFAEELARAVRGWRGNESLVIALYGPWGSVNPPSRIW